MIGFILGSMFGSAIGVSVICLCVAAKQADREMNRTDFKDDS